MIEPAFEAILFDNDGVLVDTERLYFAATREVLATIDVALNEETYVELFLRQGIGAWDLAQARGLSSVEIAALRDRRDQRYLESVGAADITIPGVRELIPSLTERYRLAIVTSSRSAPFARTHARTGLLPHFEFVLTREDYELSKPDPQPYRRAVERLGLPSARCLVIEDSERGLLAAKAAGLACWIVPSALTRGCRFAGADAVWPDLRSAVAHLLPSDASAEEEGPPQGSPPARQLHGGADRQRKPSESPCDVEGEEPE